MILASKSPRRKQLLGLITRDFRVVPASGDEIIPTGTLPGDAVEILAKQKAEELFSTEKGEIIIAADTVVSVDNVILGKPWDMAQAAEMLRTLSGRTHSVFTGVCVIFPEGGEEIFREETKVEFYPLSEEDISDYISTGEPMDKAGAYGIQDRGALFVKGIEGDYYNVMGLPVARLNRLLKQHGFGKENYEQF